MYFVVVLWGVWCGGEGEMNGEMFGFFVFRFVLVFVLTVCHSLSSV